MMLGSVHDDKGAAGSRFAAVLDQGEFRSELDRLCVSEWHWGAPQAVRTQPLKWHRERGTFEIAVETETGWHGVIGKVYDVDRAGVFRTMEAIWRAGFGPEAEFSIPQPFVYLPSVRVLLEEKVQGPSAKESLLNGTPHERIAAAERAGQWLARFHTAAPRLGDAVDIRGKFSRFQQWTDRIMSFGQPLADKGARLFRELEAAAPAPGTVEYCAGHGSYIPEHVFLTPSMPWTALADTSWSRTCRPAVGEPPPTTRSTGPWSACIAPAATSASAFRRFGNGPRSCWTKDFEPCLYERFRSPLLPPSLRAP
ncbi:MAG: hypothetical protein E6J56_11490 [Deltaproteobacteria bacterium]|nr:MAG: hypothetical protein E6J56_11490 [Deltaproteobacteria bacterium]